MTPHNGPVFSLTTQGLSVPTNGQSMNFEFPDEDIMVVTDCEVPGPDEGPEEGSRWSMHFDGASNALGNGIGAIIISPKATHTPLTARLC